MLADAGALDSLVVTDVAEAAAIWRIREDGAGLAARTSDGHPAHAGWEDAAVPPERLGAYLRDFEALLDQHGLQCVPYGHFGDGCVHGRIDFPFGSGPDRGRGAVPGLRRGRRPAGGRLRRLAVRRARRRPGPQRAAAAACTPPRVIGLFERVKALFDPDDVLNPGVLVRPARLDDDIRMAAAHPSSGRGWRWPTGTTAATSPRPCTAAPGSASAAPTSPPPAASCARPGRPRARRRTPPAAARACCRRCWRPAARSATGARRRCTTPSTCACPARAARATARPAWTWPPTRPRCCTSPTGGGCARVSHYTLGRLPLLGRPGRPRAPAGQRGARLAAGRAARQVVGRHGPAPRGAAVRAAHLPAGVGRPAGVRPAGRRPGGALGRLVHRPLRPGGRARRRPRARGGRLPGAGARRRHLLRADLDHHRPARHRPRRSSARTVEALAPLVDAGIPIVGVEPSCTAALRGEALELVGGAGRGAGRRRHPHAGRAARRHARLGAAVAGRRWRSWPSRTATTRRCSGWSADAALLARAGARGHPARRAAAGWPATGASSAATTTCRSPSPSSSCCPRCATSVRTPSSWPTGSPAAPSSTSSPAAGACTSPSCWPAGCA